MGVLRLAGAVRVVTLWRQAPLPDEAKAKSSRKLLQAALAFSDPFQRTKNYSKLVLKALNF